LLFYRTLYIYFPGV